MPYYSYNQRGAGCAYNKRANICRKIPSIPEIDPECSVLDDRCILKSETPTIQKSVEPITPQSIKKQLIKKQLVKKKSEVPIAPEDLLYISGPVSFTSFNLGNQTFNFLGDAHYAVSNNCTDIYGLQCSKTSLCKNQDTVYQTNCQDLTYFLKHLFINAKKQGKYIDFFIELPFRSKITGESPENLARLLNKLCLNDMSEIVEGKTDESGYLAKLGYLFDECFRPEKSKCEYNPNVRFHYADIRQLKMSGETSLISVFSYLFMDRIGMAVQMIKNLVKIKKQIPSMSRQDLYSNPHIHFRQIDNFMQTTNHLMKKLFLTEYTLAGPKVDYGKNLFMAHLDSDNFTQDITNIFDTMLKDLKVNTEDDIKEIIEKLKSFVSTRNGKPMHKVRIQLLELAKDGLEYNGVLMADLIRDFIIQRREDIEQRSIYQLWDRLFKIYEKLLNTTYTADVNKVINDAERFIDESAKIIEDYSKLVSSDALLMDAYTLARMFRTFSSKQRNQKHIPSDQIIVFAGDAHIDSYVDFFTNVLGLTPNFQQSRVYSKDKTQLEISKSAKRCVKTSKKYFY